MGAAVDGDAATGAGEFEAPRFRLRRVDVQRIVEAGAGGDDRANRAVGDQFAGLYDVGPVLRLLGDHEHGASLLGGGENALAARQIRRDGLFQHDVFAGRKRLQGGDFVQIVRQHQIHGVEVAVCQGVL